MSDDWQPGDLALCIKCGPWERWDGGSEGPQTDIRSGGIYRVRKTGTWEGSVILWFDEHPGNWFDDAFAASRFRKVTPPEADEFDREVIEHMTNAPIKEPVNG